MSEARAKDGPALPPQWWRDAAYAAALWSRVDRLLAQGLNQIDAARSLGVSSRGVARHVAREKAIAPARAALLERIERVGWDAGRSDREKLAEVRRLLAEYDAGA